MQQDVKGNALAERLVMELKSHQLDQAKHIAALLAKQEENIISRVGLEAVVVPGYPSRVCCIPSYFQYPFMISKGLMPFRVEVFRFRISFVSFV